MSALTNGSFESDWTGWTHPYGETIDATVAHDGSKSLKFTGSLGYDFVRQAFSAVAGHQYTLSFWMLTSGATSTSGAGANTEGSGGGGYLITTTLPTSWTFYTTTWLQPTTNTRWVVLTNSYGGTSTGTIWIDDVQVLDYTPPAISKAAVEYVVELFDSSASFGPSTKIAEIWDLRNLGWSRYDRLPGRGFFTLYQTSPTLASIVPITTHCRITRVAPAGDVEVFNGIVSDYNSTGDDVIFDIYDYVSLLSLSRSGYRTLYPTKLIGTEIVSPEWILAKNATNSPLGFVTTGTIENPLGTDDATAIKTNAQFGLMDQMRLALFYDLTEMGRANTNHHVTYEITRTGTFTFNFWKNKGSLVGIPLVLNGSVSDYQHAPNWASLRNNLATLGTTVGGGAAEVVVADTASSAVFGLRQDVFAIKTLAGIVGSTVEADQQKAVAERMLKSATEGVPSLWVTLVPGVIGPFSGWDICDTFPVEIVNGTDSITGNWRVVGARAIMDESGERLQLLVAKVLT